MSNLPSLDPLALETVTGGNTPPHTTGGGLASTTSSLATQLQTLTSTLKDLGDVKKSSGFNNTTMLMLAFMATQSRSSNVVYVHRGWW